MTDIEKLIEDLRELLKQYGEKIPHGELVGAPWPYSRAGDLVWQDPEPYFIEQAATAISALQVENEKLRAGLEQAMENNRKLCEAIMTVRKSENPAQMRVVYEMDYSAAIDHRTVRDVALIVFDGLMREDLKQRSQKEG